MLPFRVIVATHSRRSLNSRPVCALPLPPFFFYSQLSTFNFQLWTSSSSVFKLFPITVVYPLSIQPLTKCSSRNSFVLKTIHFHGGVYPPHRRSDVQTFKRFDVFPSYPLCIDILANSFALKKIATLLFSSKSELFAQNYRGVGGASC